MAHHDEGASHTHSSTGLALHTHDGLPAHTHIGSGLAPHTHDGLAPHTHEPLESPGFFSRRAPPLSMRDFHERAFTVGIGGPVGSGCVHMSFIYVLYFFSVLFLYTHVHVWLWYLYFLSCHYFIPVWHFPVFLSHEIALLVFFLVYSFLCLGYRVLFSPASYSLEQQLHYENLLSVLT